MAEIEKFDGEDFGFWKMQIEEYLYEKKLHLGLKAKKPESTSDADWEVLNRQVLSIIRSTLSKSVANKVYKAKTPAGLVASLSKIYDNPSSDPDKPREVKASDKSDVILGCIMLPAVWSFSYCLFRLARSVPPYDYKN